MDPPSALGYGPSGRLYLHGGLAGVSLPDQSVSGGLDVVNLLLPHLQLPHQTLDTTEVTFYIQ